MRRNAGRVLGEYLVASAQAGSSTALDQLVTLWHPKLLAHAYRLIGDAEIAQDITQESWGDIVKGMRKLNDSAAFASWSYRIVSRRSADTIRQIQRRRKIEAAYTCEPKPEIISAKAIECAADATPLSRAIAKLPTQQRATIALFYLEDFTVSEVAHALSVPAGTVKTRLMTARHNLRKTLEGHSHVDT